MGPAVDDHQLAGAALLPGETDAAGAEDAAVDEERHAGPHVAPPAGERAEIGPAAVLAVAEVVVLQKALAGLVADRAVDRMTQQQALLDPGLGLADLFAGGDQDRAVAHRRRAGGDELGEHRNLAGFRVADARLDQAHPATAHHRQARVPAIMRDLDPQPGGGLDAVEPLALGDFELPAVDQYARHGRVPTVSKRPVSLWERGKG